MLRSTIQVLATAINASGFEKNADVLLGGVAVHLLFKNLQFLPLLKSQIVWVDRLVRVQSHHYFAVFLLLFGLGKKTDSSNIP